MGSVGRLKIPTAGRGFYEVTDELLAWVDLARLELTRHCSTSFDAVEIEVID